MSAMLFRSFIRTPFSARRRRRRLESDIFDETDFRNRLLAVLAERFLHFHRRDLRSVRAVRAGGAVITKIGALIFPRKVHAAIASFQTDLRRTIPLPPIS